MIRLFDKTETSFTKMGYGVITDATKCTVEEELNGEYEVTLCYPVNGKLFENMQNGNIIFCKPNPYSQEQAFRIYSVEKNFDKTINVMAHHISYQLSNIPSFPSSATSASVALSNIKGNALETCPFTFWTNVTSEGTFSYNEPTSIKALLGDGDDSVVGVFGGYFEFNNYTVRLWKERGSDRGVIFRYGKDLLDMNQEENIEEVVTGICPFWKGSVKYVRNHVAMSLTSQAGYWKYDAHELVSDNGCKAVEINVSEGETYYITTTIRPSPVVAFVFYNSSNNVVTYGPMGNGVEHEYTDMEVIIPAGVTKMAVNSATVADPIIVKDTIVGVPLSCINGFRSYLRFGQVIMGEGFRSDWLTVESGQKFILDTTIQDVRVAGIVFYDDLNRALSYDLLGTGTAETITDYSFTVPSNAVKMAVQSSSSTPPTLRRESSTISDSSDGMFMLPEHVIHSNSSSFPYPKTVCVNFSSDFSYQPTETELRAKANRYFTDNENLGVPKVSLTVSAADLRKTLEYAGTPNIPMTLGDTVTVEFEELGVSSSGKVIKTVYDVLKDEYSSIDLGDPKIGLADTIVAINKAANGKS